MRPTLLPIALLYTERGESIDGTTRFQKLVFLTQEETEVPQYWEYDPAQYGPFSKQLARDIDSLIDQGFIERQTVHNRYNKEKHIYRLTNKGNRVAKKMLSKDAYDGLFDEAAKIKKQFNNIPIQELLRYVYTKYDYYAVETELDTQRVFDPEAESDFVTPELENKRLNIDAYLSEPVTFKNEDGTWTARDDDLEFTAMGQTKDKARENLARVIAASRGEGGKEVTDDFLDDIGVDPEQARDDEVRDIPGFMN